MLASLGSSGLKSTLRVILTVCKSISILILETAIVVRITKMAVVVVRNVMWVSGCRCFQISGIPPNVSTCQHTLGSCGGVDGLGTCSDVDNVDPLIDGDLNVCAFTGS